MVVKAVVFDLDGTIADFNIDYIAVRAGVRSFLISNGLPPSLLSTKESSFEMLGKAEIFMRNNGKSLRAIGETRTKALKIVEKHELEAAKDTSLLPGAIETLTALKTMKLKIGLCTINGGKSTELILKRFRISDYFDAVVPRDKVKYVKPNGDHLRVTLKHLTVKPHEAVFVGDGGVDMKCAKEAGVIAVGLPTGVATQDDLTKSGADCIITSLMDLPNEIENIDKAVGNRARDPETRTFYTDSSRHPS